MSDSQGSIRKWLVLKNSECCFVICRQRGGWGHWSQHPQPVRAQEDLTVGCVVALRPAPLSVPTR